MCLLFKTLRWLLTLALLAVGAFALGVFLDSHPQVPQERSLTADDRAWAKDWLRAARPRRMKDGEHLTLTLSEAEANVLGTYLVDTLGQGRIAVHLEDGQARLSASLGLPWNPRESFVNLDLTLAEAKPLPRIERAKLAGVPIPNGLVQRLADRFIGAMDQSQAPSAGRGLTPTPLVVPDRLEMHPVYGAPPGKPDNLSTEAAISRSRPPTNRSRMVFSRVPEGSPN